MDLKYKKNFVDINKEQQLIEVIKNSLMSFIKLIYAIIKFNFSQIAHFTYHFIIF